MTVAILNPNTGGRVTDILTALSSIGDTTKVAKFPLITLNNRPASRRIGQDIAYLQSVQVTQNVTGTGGTTTNPSSTLTPGTIHQGFTVQATPRLLDDGRILLQYSLSIIDLIGTPVTFTSNGSSVQLPTTSNRLFVQQAVLKSGSTLILGGAEEDDAGQGSQGVGDPYNYLLGGGSTSGKTRVMVFYTLTPQVLDTPHSEQD
jgi:type II secretory pathway component GspD/PulD (secretin)